MSVSNYRRSFLISTGALLALGLSTPLRAISQDSATKFAQRAFGDLQNLTAANGEAGVRNFFRTYSDVPSVARTVLGAPWRGLSSSEQQAYIQAFEGYIVRKYAKLLRFVEGGSAEITRIRDAGRGGILVTAAFKGPNGNGDVDLQIAEVGGQPKVLDLKVEGISLVGAERGTVRAMLGRSGNDFNQLLEKLNAS